jgi:hypothetical protein
MYGPPSSHPALGPAQPVSSLQYPVASFAKCWSPSSRPNFGPAQPASSLQCPVASFAKCWSRSSRPTLGPAQPGSSLQYPVASFAKCWSPLLTPHSWTGTTGLIVTVSRGVVRQMLIPTPHALILDRHNRPHRYSIPWRRSPSACSPPVPGSAGLGASGAVAEDSGWAMGHDHFRSKWLLIVYPRLIIYAEFPSQPIISRQTIFCKIYKARALAI